MPDVGAKMNVDSCKVTKYFSYGKEIVFFFISSYIHSVSLFAVQNIKIRMFFVVENTKNAFFCS